MRRIEFHDDAVEIVLTGLTMLETLQGHIVIPYTNIRTVHPELRIPPDLVRLGGAAIGTAHEGHYMGPDGWYFLSFENEDRVITLELDDFHLGRQPYCGIVVEVEDPEAIAEDIVSHMPPSSTVR